MIAIGSDHGGFELKTAVKRLLDERGLTYEDCGTDNGDSVDYPDFAEVVARGVAQGEYDRGILICGTGIGMAIAANKVAGVRAAPVNDPDSARLAREHNDANVLALGGRTLDPLVAERILDVWLETPFAGGRHARRVAKIEPGGGGTAKAEPR